MEISSVLKKIRKNNHLTQKELGNILGVSHQMISRIENSKVSVSLSLLEKIIKLFPKDFSILPNKTPSKNSINEFEKEILETYELMREENNPYSAIATFRRTLINLNQEISEAAIILNTLQDNSNFKKTLPKIKRPIKTTIRYLEIITEQLKEIIENDYIKIEESDNDEF